MAEIISIDNNKKLNIEELEKQQERESAELTALNNRVQMGYKPKTMEEAEKYFETIFAPFKTRKKIAELKGIEYKTPMEEIEEMVGQHSEKEIESGLLIVK